MPQEDSQLLLSPGISEVEKGAPNGVATLDSGGKVPSSQLPGNASTSTSGFMSAADKTKLNGIESGAQANPGVATTTANGLMSSADKTKLNGIPSDAVFTDTKNTAGSTNKTGNKMFLLGITSQVASGQSFSNANCYIGSDNALYSENSKVLTKATIRVWQRSLTVTGNNDFINIAKSTGWTLLAASVDQDSYTSGNKYPYVKSIVSTKEGSSSIETVFFGFHGGSIPSSNWTCKLNCLYWTNTVEA